MNEYTKMIEKAMAMIKEDDSLKRELVCELDSWDGRYECERFYDMYDFDDFFCGCKPLEILEKIDWTDFNPSHNYFRFTIYGVVSSAYEDYDDIDDGELLDSVIDEYNNLYINNGEFSSLVEDFINYNDEEKTA